MDRERRRAGGDARPRAARAPGRYILGDVEITLDDDRVLRNDAGVLAGSVLTLDRAVRNLVSSTGCEPAAAIATATSTPARLLGESSIGTLTVGARADIVVLDEALVVRATLIDGVAVYDRDGRFAGANATDRTEPRRGAPTWRS